MPRAAIYARVSSLKQRDAESIKSQLSVLVSFVERQGWPLVDTYVDDGKSAKTGKLEKRDGFARLMADAEARRFDLLVVLDVSRLTRTGSIEERALILGPFQRLGIDIVTPSGGAQDLRSFLGEFYVTLQAQISAEENRKRAEAIMAGKLRAIADGRKPAGPTPFGYRYGRKEGWSVDPAAAAIVQEIHARVAGGESCEALARDLDTRGVERPRGGFWSRERVWNLATARTYLGEWTADRGRGLTIAVPAILDEATWTATQRALTQHRKRGLDRTRHVYLCAGITRCALCEARVGVSTGSGPEAGKVRQTYYVCGARRRPPRGAARCALPFWHAAGADERVWSAVADTIGRRDFVDRALAAQARGRRAAPKDWAREVATEETALERISRAETAMLARFRRGAISEAAMDVELVAIERDRRELGDRLATARRELERAAGADLARGQLVGLHESVAGLRQCIRRATIEDKRELVVALLGEEGIVMGEDSITAVMRVRTGSLGAAGLGRSYETSPGRLLEIRLVA